jgi:L-Ala-D/L-Glu epimerase
VKLAIERHTLRLRNALHTSYGAISERELLAVSITDEDGLQGHGEAAPLPAYDGVATERVQAALARYRSVLAGASASGGELLERCRAADPLPAALAAIDMALWDRAGRREGKPVAALLSDRPARAVAVNATLTALTRPELAEQAARAVDEGFRCLKLKVGSDDDRGRVAAVRAAAGPSVALRLDAKGAWGVDEAARAIAALAPAGLELVEEPVHGLHAVRELRERVTVKIAIDETTAEDGALASGAADAVCLKLSRCGGISALLACAALARSCGTGVYLASTLDGPLGIAAALHAAAALSASGSLPPCGLATLSLFCELEDPLPPRGGEIALPAGAGLGVAPL